MKVSPYSQFDHKEIMIEAGFVLEVQTKCDFYFKNQVQK